MQDEERTLTTFAASFSVFAPKSVNRLAYTHLTCRWIVIISNIIAVCAFGYKVIGFQLF